MLARTTRFVGLAALALFASTFAAGCAAEDGSEEPVAETGEAIVGGQAADEVLAIGYLSLLDENNQVVEDVICTANLIAPDVVVTAAHCLETTGYTFGFGLGKVGGRRGIIPAISGAYDRSYHQVPSRDIGYLVLAEPVRNVQPLQIQRTSHASGCNYIATGYGITKDGYEGGAVNANDYGARKAASMCVTDGYLEGFISAVGRGGSPCNGDSGGALRRGRVMIGVLSAGVGACDRHDQTYYAPTATNLQMIDEALSKSRVK